jgi:hypothetical protein
LLSYKLRLAEGHVRAVPAEGLRGERFTGPGVDLRGEDALRAIAAARPILAWLDAREPGVVVRSISVAIQHPRVLVTLEPGPNDARPRALRFDPPHADELRDAGRAAETVIGEACIRALLRRARA